MIPLTLETSGALVHPFTESEKRKIHEHSCPSGGQQHVLVSQSELHCVRDQIRLIGVEARDRNVHYQNILVPRQGFAAAFHDPPTTGTASRPERFIPREL